MGTLLLLFSSSVLLDSLWLHGLQHARHSCSLLSPRACSNSCPSTQWSYLTVSSSVIPFSSCLQYFSASKFSPMGHLFPLGGQSIVTSAQHQSFQWKFRVDFLSDWGLISLLFNGISRIFPSTTVWKHQFFSAQPSLWSNSHIHTWLLEKP